MSKPKVPAPLAPPAPAAAPLKVLSVKAGQKFRGAREAWYGRLVQFDGKPLAEFVASVTANRPSVYGSKSKHHGQPEPVPGWVRYFFRTGVCTEVEQKPEAK